MKNIVIAIASDHAGFDLKQQIISYLDKKKYQIIDLGCSNKNSVDYPDYANKLAEAIAQYDKAIQIHKTFGEAINHKGIALLSQNKCPEAIAVFDRAIQLNAKDAIAYNFRGVCLHNLKKPEEALKSYNKGK